jgi:hypothetical protein
VARRLQAETQAFINNLQYAVYASLIGTLLTDKWYFIEKQRIELTI